ncbi:MAG: hypothetical protein Q8L87_14130 [Anaerolineales bacterium]|nr:hypothetical protein [Anaerolineales bacterium]
MNVMRHNLHITVSGLLALFLLTLTACDGMTVTPSTEGEGLFPMATQIGEPCEACAQATLAAALTQQKISADNQGAATAEIVRANAQATVNSANATLSAAQTQSQNNANIVAAQIAGTAEIVRANAQATLNSAGATQYAAQTQDAIQQTQMANMATTSAEAVLAQQGRDNLAAGTQTAVADNIATQTQSAAATSQWYADQERQREEERQGPIAFLWTWCFPIFLVALASLTLWGFRRWLSIQQSNQRILENPVERLPLAEVRPHRHDDRLPYIESDVVDSGYQVTTPDDQVHQWLDEVKDELLRSDEEEKDDDAGD